MKNIKLLLTGAILTTFASCVNGDHYGVVEGECASLTPTTEIDVIDGMAMSNYQQWIGEDVLEAYVTSSDEGGNFYKNISMVAYDALGNEYGFSVPVDQYNLYNEFEPGRKVYINLNELYYEIDGRTSSLELGFLNTNDNTDPSDDEVGRISLNRYQEKIIRSCDKMNEDDLVHHLTVTEAQDDQYLNKLIEFDAVQFTDVSLGHTYFDSSLNPFPTWTGTNHYLADADGNTVILRASEYATFAGDMIPSGNGKVRGVMTKYNSDYQFMIRTINDVMLDNPRVVPLFEETWDTNWDLWTKYSVTGAQEWTLGTDGYGNPGNYARMSGYSSGNNTNDDWLISPAIDLSAVTTATLTFDTAKNYSGNDLEAFVSTDYDGSSAPSTATWTPLSANLSSGSWNWVSSGAIDLSSYTGGNIYVAFRYTSTTSASSTWEVDNVKVEE